MLAHYRNGLGAALLLYAAREGHAAFCFGAKVEIRVGDRRQIRWWGSDVSYLSQHASDVIFGLGPAAKADRLRVQWADGRVSTFDGVPPGVVTIDHDSAVVPAP
jgi:hypothetical protein